MLVAHHLEYSAKVHEMGDRSAYSGSYKDVAIAVVSSGFGSSEVLSCCGMLMKLGVTSVVYLGACISTDRRHGLGSVIFAGGGSHNLLNCANTAAKRYDLAATVRTVLTPGTALSEEGCIIDEDTGAFYELAREGEFDALAILTVSENAVSGEKMEEPEVRSRFYAASRLAFETIVLA